MPSALTNKMFGSVPRGAVTPCRGWASTGSVQTKISSRNFQKSFFHAHCAVFARIAWGQRHERRDLRTRLARRGDRGSNPCGGAGGTGGLRRRAPPRNFHRIYLFGANDRAARVCGGLRCACCAAGYFRRCENAFQSLAERHFRASGGQKSSEKAPRNSGWGVSLAACSAQKPVCLLGFLFASSFTAEAGAANDAR